MLLPLISAMEHFFKSHTFKGPILAGTFGTVIQDHNLQVNITCIEKSYPCHIASA
jgi:hypothetical protein